MANSFVAGLSSIDHLLVSAFGKCFDIIKSFLSNLIVFFRVYFLLSVLLDCAIVLV